MNPSPELRDKMLVETREAAAAFIEDLAHLREVLQRTDPIRGEVRRLSGILRRFLTDYGGDLRKIAPPRIGRITINGPDNSAFYRAARNNPYLFFGSGGCRAFGIWHRATTVDQSSRSRKIDELNPEGIIELTHDGFLNQKVLCLKGEWATRRDVILFVANTASGVHSGSITTEKDRILAAIRNVASYSTSLHNEEPCGLINFNLSAAESVRLEFDFTPLAIDPVLFELLAAADYFANSPRIFDLESFIKSELCPELPA
jgi:hypothetical protein